MNYWKKIKFINENKNYVPNISLFRFLSACNFAFKGKKVLDVGFLHGADLLEFKRRKAEVYGVDINPDSIRLLKSKLGSNKIKYADITKEPIPFKKKFDLIYHNDFLYYLSYPQINKHFEDVCSKLKKNSFFLIQFIQSDFINIRTAYIKKKFSEIDNPVKFLNEKKLLKLSKKNKLKLYGKKILIESYDRNEKKIRINKYLLFKKNS
jgi:2-polyprenyl-3-methyl-5-hydroxy-6-metoxy-1,4-benzoquinol methylase